MAECMLGRGDRAWKYYRQLIPAIAMQKAGAWRYKAEPYVYASNLFGPESDKFGLANVSWLTGTASWMYVVATQNILGIKPEWEGLKIDPCLPSDWKKVSIKRVFRGKKYNFQIFKSKGSCTGVERILLNGTELGSNLIPSELALNENQVEVYMK
jgi:cellobiose phosphorylase